MLLMAPVNAALPLSPPDPRFDWLSSRCCVQRSGSARVLIIGGAPLLRFEVDDRVQTRLAAAMIAESKAAPVGEVLRAFKMDEATLWRWRRRFRDKGATALLPAKTGPKGPSKLRPEVVRRIEAFRAKGLTKSQIAEQVGLSVRSVSRILASAVEVEIEAVPLAEQTALPLATPIAADAGESSSREPVVPVAATPPEPPAAADVENDDATQGVSSRPPSQDMAAALAMLGMTKDGETEVVFETRKAVPFAGVLLAIAALNATGLLEASREVYGRLNKAVYGLRATVLTLFLMALLRRPRPEALKSADPGALGDIMGLLRAPEVKTVRRKLLEIAGFRKAHELMRALGTRWLREREDELGILYVDGHVRAYHGKRRLSKAFVTQKNLCAPGTTDFWVNGADGDPIFLVTGDVNPALTKVLPPLLREIEEMSGDRKGTVVFDRGGWSPKMFAELIRGGWDILTYRKGKKQEHPVSGFSERTETIDGRKVTYTLSERTVRVKTGRRTRLTLREIAELREDGGQTIFVTSNLTANAVLLAHRMFGRWRQENYFRYMLENFALDALVDYDSEEVNPNRDVPNPERKAADRRLALARAEVAKLERELGMAASDNDETVRHTMRGFKIANAELGKALRDARTRVEQLETARQLIPKRILVGQLPAEEQVVQLSSERKLFTDAIKAAAYRAEGMLLNILRPNFKRADDEGRAFLRNVVTQRGDIFVEGDTLKVTLAPMSAPRFTAALRALCHELNSTNVMFPESGYRIRYAVTDQAEGL